MNDRRRLRVMKNLKVTWILLVIALLTLAACTVPAPTPTQPAPAEPAATEAPAEEAAPAAPPAAEAPARELVYAEPSVINQLDSIDPRGYPSSYEVVYLLYDQLVRFDANLEIQP